MKVKVWIELLQLCDPDYIVYFNNYDGPLERITDYEQDNDTQSVTLF